MYLYGRPTLIMKPQYKGENGQTGIYAPEISD